mmetsp:Transcript_8487/g.18246  ORF Transcript_8487/g.18246 Transcript_8487/m.18246 type:complete len:581 (+) Transcript_8487:216-1958(+)
MQTHQPIPNPPRRRGPRAARAAPAGRRPGRRRRGGRRLPHVGRSVAGVTARGDGPLHGREPPRRHGRRRHVPRQAGVVPGDAVRGRDGGQDQGHLHDPAAGPRPGQPGAPRRQRAVPGGADSDLPRGGAQEHGPRHQHCLRLLRLLQLQLLPPGDHDVQGGGHGLPRGRARDQARPDPAGGDGEEEERAERGGLREGGEEAPHHGEEAGQAAVRVPARAAEPRGGRVGGAQDEAARDHARARADAAPEEPGAPAALRHVPQEAVHLPGEQGRDAGVQRRHAGAEADPPGQQRRHHHGRPAPAPQPLLRPRDPFAAGQGAGHQQVRRPAQEAHVPAGRAEAAVPDFRGRQAQEHVHLHRLAPPPGEHAAEPAGRAGVARQDAAGARHQPRHQPAQRRGDGSWGGAAGAAGAAVPDQGPPPLQDAAQPVPARGPAAGPVRGLRRGSRRARTADGEPGPAGGAAGHPGQHDPRRTALRPDSGGLRYGGLPAAPAVAGGVGGRHRAGDRHLHRHVRHRLQVRAHLRELAPRQPALRAHGRQAGGRRDRAADHLHLLPLPPARAHARRTPQPHAGGVLLCGPALR